MNVQRGDKIYGGGSEPQDMSDLISAHISRGVRSDCARSASDFCSASLTSEAGRAKHSTARCPRITDWTRRDLGHAIPAGHLAGRGESRIAIHV